MLTSWPVFISVTLGIMGFAAYMTGQALAHTWKPIWQAIVYSLLLGGVDRFLVFALFDGELLSLRAYAIDALMLTGVALVAFQRARARKMVIQYPWLYKPQGPFRWRRIKADPD